MIDPGALREVTVTDLPVAPERAFFIQEAAVATAAIRCAKELGVFERLDAAPASSSELARECGMEQRGARALLSALVGLGLVKAGGDGSYRATVHGLGTLAPLNVSWEQLIEAVRDGRPVVAGDTPDGAEALYPDVVPFLGAMFAPIAEAAADHLAGQDLRILDAGSGSAPWSLAVVARNRSCRVTAVDLPEVLPATRRAAAAAGLGHRFDYVAGDLFAVELEASAFDVAIAGNLCHLFDEAANRRLLHKLFGALRPGGRLAIVDVVPNERLGCSRSVALYALGLLLRTRSGEVYPFSTYAGWLRETGYEGIDRVELSADKAMSLITARRPS